LKIKNQNVYLFLELSVAILYIHHVQNAKFNEVSHNHFFLLTFIIIFKDQRLFEA